MSALTDQCTDFDFFAGTGGRNIQRASTLFARHKHDALPGGGGLQSTIDECNVPLVAKARPGTSSSQVSERRDSFHTAPADTGWQVSAQAHISVLGVLKMVSTETAG